MRCCLVHCIRGKLSNLATPQFGHYYCHHPTRLPSKVTRSFTHRVRLPASHNNVLQHIAIFPDGIIAA